MLFVYFNHLVGLVSRNCKSEFSLNIKLARRPLTENYKKKFSLFMWGETLKDILEKTNTIASRLKTYLRLSPRVDST